MTHLFNNDFTETTADSRNYLTWAMDTEIMLTAEGFIDDINKPNTQAQFQTQPNTLLPEISYSRISKGRGNRSPAGRHAHRPSQAASRPARTLPGHRPLASRMQGPVVPTNQATTNLFLT